MVSRSASSSAVSSRGGRSCSSGSAGRCPSWCRRSCSRSSGSRRGVGSLSLMTISRGGGQSSAAGRRAVVVSRWSAGQQLGDHVGGCRLALSLADGGAARSLARPARQALGPRPHEGGGGIRRATGPPGGGGSRCSVAAVSRRFERHRF